MRKFEMVIKEVGAVSIKDMGKVMKVLMPKLTGKADGKMVGGQVKRKVVILKVQGKFRQTKEDDYLERTYFSR